MDYELNVDVLNEYDESEEDLESLWYDQYLMARVGPLKVVVSKVIDIVEAARAHGNPRLRKRKPVDQSSFEACMEGIVSNLSHAVVQSDSSIPLIVSRATSKRTMYDNGRMPAKTFVSCLNDMEQAGLITQTIGAYKGKATTIEATQGLREMIRGCGVDFTCFRECPSRPLLILKRSTKVSKTGKTRKYLVTYVRNTVTDAMVAQVGRLNAFLSDAKIDFIDDEASDHRVATNRRTLVRYFTIRGSQRPRFDQGGRLFGRCFWLALPSTERHRIRIDGEPVADLDFKNLGPRLVYARMGKEPPSGDLYDLTGHLADYHNDNPAHRKAIKRSLSACLNGAAGGKRGTPPKGDKPGTVGILDDLPRGITAAKIRKALIGKHPDFKGILEACGGPQEPAEVPIGFTIMFDESRILLRALEMLMDQGVAALPQHDGLLVARSNQRIAQEALEEASKEIVGVVVLAEVKADYGAPEATEGLLAA